MLERPRILLVEDEPAIADTIRYVIAGDGMDCAWCATAAEALREFQAQRPDCAILDVGLPDLNGFELLRRLQDTPGGRNVPVLFLTARSDEIDRVVGLELGADDYVAKPFSPRELLARVRAILRRQRRAGAAPSTPAVAHGPLVVDDERRQVRYHGQLLELSRYEYGLLRELVRHPGRVYSRAELLERVWDADAESFDRTVDAHVKTLRAKLKAVSAEAEPIRTVRGEGYALADGL